GSSEVRKIQRTWKNRLWQRKHRHGTTKKSLSIHSNAPCLLERRISAHPHCLHTIGFMAPSFCTNFLPFLVNNRVKDNRQQEVLICAVRHRQRMSMDQIYP